MRDFVLPSAWLAMWQQEPDSDKSDESPVEWSEDEDKVEDEVEVDRRATETALPVCFSSKTGTCFEGVFKDLGTEPEGQKSSLAEPYMVARRGKELLCCKTALGAAVAYADYIFAKHGRTAKVGGPKGWLGKVKLRMREPQPEAGLLEGWTCTKHWATNRPMYKKYTGPNGEVRTDRALRQKLRQKWYDTKSTGLETEAASAPVEARAPVTEQQPSGNTTLGTADGAASDDKHAGTFEAAMEVEVPYEEAVEEEAVKEKPAEAEAAEEEVVVVAQPAEGAAGAKMDDERESFAAAEEEARETDNIEEQQPQMDVGTR